MGRKQADAAGPDAASDAPSSSPAELDPRGLRLLIVEDDRTLREGLGVTLAAEGFDIHTACTGAEALSALGRTRFDIVLTDLHLTPVTGLDVLRAALEARPPSVVIVMTGDASLENSLAVVRAGAWDCLPKPFSASLLRSLLERAVQLAVRRRGGSEGGGTGRSVVDERVVSEFERVYLSRLVRDASGNLERAARLARVDRSTLDRLMAKHDLGAVP